MYKKTCPSCGEPSYSAGCSSRWDCPHCGADLTEENTETAGKE